jgi:bacterioferritin-associated ferredoxin
MAANRRPGRQGASKLAASTRHAHGTKAGFASLDPAKLGLDMPEWVAPAPPTPPTLPAPDMPANPTTPCPATPDAGAALPPSIQALPGAANLASRPMLEGLKVVCICKGIKKRTFWKVMADGAQTHEEINRLTGSGSGGCQGRRCGPRICEMLQDLSQS